MGLDPDIGAYEHQGGSMAKPIITNILVDPSTIPPGGSSLVTIEAYDPDEVTSRFTAIVTDSTGESATSNFYITVSDPLTYEVEAPSGWTVASDGSDFTITDI